ncbi:MoxR family ATPase [uncultured Rubinisphaera sp.]|uniref:AAA family ATPase n=1 Tax=uncultured Rubinisphaera sp. TaxID=1678686 RepID=UPI0030D769B3|tara:strand:- start:6570 stop:7613 length:1044 start_codon:yes stop_codon:yes gene_type:complete
MANDQQQIYKSGLVETPSSDALRVAGVCPPWRVFAKKENATGEFQVRPMSERQERKGKTFQATEIEARMVDASLVLRRPLLVEGDPGLGKTSLAYSVAWQLGLGDVFKWPITSRSNLKDALYRYDAIARLQDAPMKKDDEEKDLSKDIGKYLSLGPLGSALIPQLSGPYQPRVLLIDEIDKSDIDLPNDLLHILEEGVFEIPEIARLNLDDPVDIRLHDSQETFAVPPSGLIQCDDFPLIIMTTNGEREFPPAFYRRCLRLRMSRPDGDKLRNILSAHLNIDTVEGDSAAQLENFLAQITDGKQLAIDQLLNAIYLTQSSADVNPEKHAALKQAVMQALIENGPLGS